MHRFELRVIAVLLGAALLAAPAPAFADEAGAVLVQDEPATSVVTETASAEQEGQVELVTGPADGNEAEGTEGQADQAGQSGSTTQEGGAGSANEEAPASDDASADDSSQAASKPQAVTNDGAASDDGSVADAPAIAQGRWVVSAAYGQGLQRYWFVGDDMSKDRLVTPDEGAGYYAYATPAGYVVRGIYVASDGTVYVADNDGKLAGPGWAVGSYGQELQRYWVDADKHGCVPGYSDDGWAHYTTPAGYVARGAYKASDGTVYVADNDGRLAGPGWVVGSYGQGLQRYWVDADRHGCVPGYSADGWSHYTTTNGYVARGACKTSDGSLYYADNDGRLSVSTWLVTSAFGSGLQRYWMGGDGAAAKDRLVTPDEGAGWYAYATSNGYVVRGVYAASDGTVYVANNDGRLAGPGWVVGDYGQGLQRYWVDADRHGCVPGYSDDGWAHCTTSAGYVLRGVRNVGGLVYVANNDGKLAGPGWAVGNYGQGLQRYYISDADHAAHPGFFTVDAKDYYTRNEGYVLRGTLGYDSDGVLLADNEGVLVSLADTTNGWLVTSKYAGSLQRYRIDDCCGGHIGAHVGLFSLGGAQYYGVPGSGYVLRNSFYTSTDASMYWADNDGKLSYVGMLSGDRLHIWNYSSPTSYLISVNLSAHQVTVYSGSQQNWTPIHIWTVSTGAPSTPTSRGVFSIGSRGYSFGHGYTCYYWTQFNGDILFHSVLYNQGTFTIQDGRLGMSISHGCVRMSIDDARWINQNIPSGTTVVSY